VNESEAQFRITIVIFLAKNYNNTFEFVKVMPKVLSVLFFPRHGV